MGKCHIGRLQGSAFLPTDLDDGPPENATMSLDPSGMLDFDRFPRKRCPTESKKQDLELKNTAQYTLTI